MHFCQRCPVQTALRSDGDRAVCPVCGTAEPVRRRPLFVVTGASGSGKSTVLPWLADAVPECVVFDVDWLIDPFTAAGAGQVNWPAFRDGWLSVAHGVAQGRRSTVLLGTFQPEQLADLPAREWVGDIHFAVLDCTDEQRRARLAARPPWREHDIERHVAFAAHLRRSIRFAVPTDDGDPARAAALLAAWIRSR